MSAAAAAAAAAAAVVPTTGNWAKGTGFGGQGGGGGHYMYGGYGGGAAAAAAKAAKAAAAAETGAQKRQEAQDKQVVKLIETGWLPLLSTLPPLALPPALQRLLGGPFSGATATAPPSLPASSVPLLELLRLWLRNDSLVDMSARKEIYMSLLDVVQALSRHPFLAPSLTMPLKDDEDAAAETEEEGGREGGREGGSILALLERLQTQATFFQRCGGRTGGSMSEKEEEAMMDDLLLSTKVSDTHDMIRQQLQRHQERYFLEFKAFNSVEGKLSSDNKKTAAGRRTRGGMASLGGALAAVAARVTGGGGGGGGKSANAQEKEKAAAQAQYTQVLGALRFDSLPLLAMVEERKAIYSFLPQAQAGAAQGRSVAQRRTVHIMREVAALSTSLPVEYGSGIFVRVDEERPDVLKALITGPEDTPYSFGCFEFDIFLPTNYPASPPSVKFLTTGGGMWRCNPNLYQCGKVCLSLLGTWAGPGWNPAKSTLLQVLVSIQSLILVPDPYFNEPGYQSSMGTAQGTAASNRYNQGVRYGTLQHAILGQMRSPSAVFKDVCLKHFALKRTEILAQCQKWVKEGGPGGGVGGGVAAAAAAATAWMGAVVTGQTLQPVCSSIEQMYKSKEAAKWLEG